MVRGISAIGFSLFLVLLINSFIIPGLPTIAGAFEVTFVNTFGLPFGSGALFLTILVIGSIIFGLRFTAKDMVNLNTLILSIAFVLLGYSCYAIILIRSQANPPIDQNNPENVMNFVSYLKREQYGSRPLLYGQYYNAQQTDIGQGAPDLLQEIADKYVVSQYKTEVDYDPNFSTFLPRMWSSTAPHPLMYKKQVCALTRNLPSLTICTLCLRIRSDTCTSGISCLISLGVKVTYKMQIGLGPFALIRTCQKQSRIIKEETSIS